MIKKKWGDLLGTFKEGAVKFATRKLPAREAEKCERLLDEQRRLADNLARAFALFDAKLQKISGYIERSMEGEMERLEPYIKDLQKELAEAIVRADLAVSDIAELERELADWQRNPNKTSDSKNSRLDSLRAELEARRPSTAHRCALTPAPLPQEQERGSDSPLSPAMWEKGGPQYNQNEGRIEGSSPVEKHGRIAYVEVRSADMEPNAEHLAQHIKELSRELGRYQQTPSADPHESLRMASEIKSLHTILRQADKKIGNHRDRIAATDGFRHVFVSH
ncbi:MAG: hypothetical protein PHS79_06075 [Patescibacteria group bacterium]|nr:hypothetical protein [Patescibacteria group bacterium]